MIDIKFLRENPDAVKENIRKKFQDAKLPLVDEVIEFDKKARAAQVEADELRAQKNQLSKQIGQLMKEGKREEAEKVKAQVAEDAAKLDQLTADTTKYQEEVQSRMMRIPNIIDPSVPIGPDREVWRTGSSRFRDSLPHRHYGSLRRYRHGCCR